MAALAQSIHWRWMHSADCIALQRHMWMQGCIALKPEVPGCRGLRYTGGRIPKPDTCDIQVGASPSTLQILVYHHHALQRVLPSGLLQVVATTSSTEQSLRWPGAWMQWCRAQVQVQSAGAATEVPWCLDAV